MARNISLANGHVPFSFSKLFGTERTSTLSINHGSPKMSDVLRSIRETVTLIAAAGRVGAAVEAHRAPSAADLKAAGLEAETFTRPQYRF
ncbi:hypothetical protein [Methylopila sp. M107]|uniref:hypothetical protein n=1 Tax=Methylopila sp. M107 TaxID=1101190 RepID=UPI0003A063D5|nr:hypothetical protein [Methylopila sp. M107]